MIPAQRRSLQWTVALFVGLWAWHGLLLGTWLYKDRRPARWDESVHLSTALDYRNAFAAGSWGGLLVTRPRPGHPPYPPLVHYGMAPLLALADGVGASPEDAATWVNMVFLIVLSLAVWAMVSAWWGNGAGLCAAFLATLSPPVLLAARAPMVDLALAAFVAAAYACWVRSEHFSHRGWTYLLGFVAAAGMLSKWSFPFYALPVAADAVRVVFTDDHGFRRRWIVRASAITAALIAPWYLVNLPVFLPRVLRSAGQGAGEGDPSVMSWTSWMWYPRLAWEQLTPAGFLLGAAGLGWLAWKRSRGGGVLAAWLAAGYAFWSLVSNKNDRYFLPLLTVFPLAAAALPFRLPALASAGAVALSAWTAWGSAGGTLARPADPHPWPLEEVARRVIELRDPAEPFAVLTVAVNHDYLNANNLTWTVHRLGLARDLAVRSKLDRVGQLSQFVLTKTGDLGPGYASGRQAVAREEILRPKGWFARAFEPAASWDLPDGSRALLFHRRAAAAEAVDPALGLGDLAPGVEFKGLAAQTGPSALFQGESLCRVSAEEVYYKGLVLGGARLHLDGVWVARDDEGRPRLVRVRRVQVESFTLSSESAARFLSGKARWLSDAAVTFSEGNRIRIEGRAGPLLLRVRGEFGYRAGGSEFPVLFLRPEEVRVGPLSLPVSWLGGELKTVLRPQKGVPFYLAISGLRTAPVPGGAEGGWRLEVAPFKEGG